MDEQPRTWNRLLLTGGVILLACCPFLAASLFTVRVPKGTAVTNTVEKPALVFAQYAVNMRELPIEPVVHAHFDFWNRGKEPLTITELIPSCACLGPQLMDNKRTYEPGEHGRFYLQVRTANEEPGRKEYTVQVNYTCGEEVCSRQVTFKAIVPAMKISIEPPQLVFYQMSGQPASQTVYVSDYRGNPLQVVSAEIGRDDVEAVVLDREIDKQGQIRIPILVEVAGEVPTGRTTTRLRIKTTDPEFSELQIPVFLFGTADQGRMAHDRTTSGEEDAGVIQVGHESAKTSEVRKQPVRGAYHEEP